MISFNHGRLVALVVGSAMCLPSPAQQVDYVVLAATASVDPFDAAAQALVEHHRAELVRFDPAALEPVRAALRRAQPRHVALVMRPEQIEFGFQRRFLQLATELDDDPFVDFAFGYLTGRTGAEALALAQRGIARRPEPVDDGVADVIGGVERSQVGKGVFHLRRQRLDQLQILSAGESVFPAAGRDVEFLRAQLPKLKGRDVVTFVGHGYPREVVGGPTFAELAGLVLDGAVVLNVACYTGVTNRWYEDDWRAAVLHERTVPLDESFCLSLLRTGVVGYTAYLCPRPAGPELATDLAALVVDGMSLGEARRRDYDKTVLGFLGFGEGRLQLEPVEDGAKFAPQREAVRDIMLEGATGGVLFGDPACVPFAARDGEAPVTITTGAQDGAIVVKARAAVHGLYQHCSDPTAEWGQTMAMRVHARLPLGDRHVTDLVVDELRVGDQPQPSRVLWAIETDRGERFVQLKINFPRPTSSLPVGMRMTARLLTTGDPALGKAFGGEVRRRRAASQDVASRELSPLLLERATAREVSREVMQHALDASADLLAGRGDERIAAFATRGSEGFRAVCALLEVGHAHVHTTRLLQLTWRPGDERHLLALASGPNLPNYATWIVLRGLGTADTAEVRAYLQQRLAQEPDAGCCMSIAQALAQLGVREAIAPIAARVRAFEPGWAGVMPYLIESLEQLGGDDAIAALEAIGLDAGCGDPAPVLAALARLSPAVAERVRAARTR
ncbi:MAG: hypothetical protein MUC36_05560 [Planctomycetes bacterium]|nr:hypothetical protein [Planctomycetota bacterium]